MFKNFFTIVFTAAALVCAAEQQVKFNYSTAAVKINPDSVDITVICREPNMAHIKNYYSVKRWDVFGTDSIELQFSPYNTGKSSRMPFPHYRMLVNPSGNYITAFLTSNWKSSGIVPKVDKITDEYWSINWHIDFASIESTFYNVPGAKPLLPANQWRLDFKHRRRAGGKQETFSAKPLIITIPAAAFAPFRQLAAGNIKISQEGSGLKVSTDVTNYSVHAFSGKAELLLYSDGKAETAAVTAVNFPIRKSTPVEFTIKLPERAVKFAAAVKFIAADGKVVRITRLMPVKNPFVE